MAAVKPIPDGYRSVPPHVDDVPPDEIARRAAAMQGASS